MLWDERLEEQFDLSSVNSQDVQMFFFDVDESAETFGLRDVDAKVPYARINITTNEVFVTTLNHMVSTKRMKSKYSPYPDPNLGFNPPTNTAAPAVVLVLFLVRDRRGGS